MREKVLIQVTLAFIVIASFLLYCRHTKENISDNHRSAKYTVRVNTFRRPDLLEEFLSHYSKCQDMKEIQVIWSDLSMKPPNKLLTIYPKSIIKFEVHKNDSLCNRFQPLLPILTEAVVSLDDDLIIPCDTLSRTFAVWRSNKRALVGFSPRLHAWDPESGAARYLRWQHTWWNGAYSILLTKAAFLHKDYLHQFQQALPASVRRFVDDNMNCEDIAMAHIVAKQSRAAPVWVQGYAAETASAGISSGDNHFATRSHCLQLLEDAAHPSVTPWVIGYQKVVPMSLFQDFTSLWHDTK